MVLPEYARSGTSGLAIRGSRQTEAGAARAYEGEGLDDGAGMIWYMRDSGELVEKVTAMVHRGRSLGEDGEEERVKRATESS